MAEQNNSEPRKVRTARPKDIINHFAKVISACLIMMWGVINLVHNGLGWRAFDGESESWWLTGIGAGLTGLIPMAIGIWMLLRTTAKTAT